MNSCAKSFSLLPRPAWGGATRWRALGFSLLVIVAAALQAAPARADVWGYVNAQGTAHFSSTQLDDRYELFFRGGESFNTGNTGNTGTGPGLLGKPPKLLAFFDISPNYKAVRHLLREASLAHGIDYELLQALIATESRFDTHAVSPKGAVGLMQLIPPTAERYGVRADKTSAIEKKLTDPRINIRAGSRYLSYLIKLFPGQLELALAAYNAGEGAVKRAGNKIPNYPETKNYVKTVMQLYNHLKPPVAMAASGRVRMEMMGGTPGRGNMVPLREVSSPSPEAKAVRD